MVLIFVIGIFRPRGKGSAVRTCLVTTADGDAEERDANDFNEAVEVRATATMRQCLPSKQFVSNNVGGLPDNRLCPAKLCRDECYCFHSQSAVPFSHVAVAPCMILSCLSRISALLDSRGIGGEAERAVISQTFGRKTSGAFSGCYDV